MSSGEPDGSHVALGRWRWERIVLAGILSAAVAFAIARSHETELIAAQFASDANRLMSEVRHGIDRNLELPKSFEAFFASSNAVDRREFLRFAASQLEQHRSLRAVAWVPRVPASERARHEQAMRDEGDAGYAVFEKDASGHRPPLASRDVYYPLAYVAPAAKAAQCQGLDLAARPDQVAAMERSLASGSVAITIRTDANPADGSTSEIVAAVLPVATATERRAHTHGFVQINFCPADLIAALDTAASGPIALRLTDESNPTSTRVLADQAPGLELDGATVRDLTLSPCGSTWRLRAIAPRAYFQEQRTLRTWIWAVLAAAIAMLVATLVEVIRGQARRVETEVRERTADLAASEARYRALFDGASDLIVSVSPDGKIELANHAWAEILGDPAAAGRGNLHDLVPSARHAELEAQVAELLRRNDTGEMSIVVVDRDGKNVELEGHARVRRHGGHAIAIQAILRNVTERRRLEEVLAQREQSLRESNKMQAVSQLAGGLAHEFNNLLTTISGFAQFLAESLAGSPDMKQDVDEILVAAERGSQLTRQLLMFTHQQPSRPEPLELNSRLTLLIPTLRLLTGRGIQLSLDLDPSEPRVEIDHAQFEQVLINLVGNARDAMPKGGAIELSTRVVVLTERLALATGVLDPGRYAVIRVRDTGEGISADVRKRLFEPFFTTRTQRHAAGLGLSIAYGVISQAGGGISVESEVGQGTSVDLYLPRSTSATTDKIARMTTISGARILLAEDEAQVRQMTARILRQASFEVIEARDGLEALAIVERRAGELGLLVTDVIMPNMGGAELAQRAIAIDPGLPVIYVSGYTAQGLSEHGVLMPECELIHKPFSAELFIEKVRERTRFVKKQETAQPDAPQ